MLDLRDLRVPVIGAPMAGGPTTPQLAAAVTDAGGLGFLAAGYRRATDLADDLAEARAATTGPLGVNLFVVEPYDVDPAVIDAYRREIEPEAARLGAALGEPRWDDDDWTAKLEVVLDERPELVSFTFGCPDAEVLRRLADRGIHTTVTVTSAAEALEAAARGAGSLSVQGPDAGGHRGAWDPAADPDRTPLHDLLAAVVAAVEVPVVAGGGIAEPGAVEAVLVGGAVAAQVGTAYLLAEEAGTKPVHRAALADPAMTHTAVTRAYTGRWARGLANRFMSEHQDAPVGYPQVHHLTAPLRAAAAAAGDAQVAHLWAGTRHALAREASAGEITRALAP